MSAGSIILNQPGVYFVDADGNVLSADDGTAIANHEGIIIAGSDGTNMRFMRVATDGTLRVDPTGTTTQPVSVASLPLPTGAATEATLATLATETKLELVRALLATIDADTSALVAVDYATQTTLASLLSAFNAEDFASETTLAAFKVAFDGTDFATQTTLASLLSSFNAEDFASETTLAAFKTNFDGTDFATQTTLAALLTAFNAEDFASQTTLAALLAAFNAEDFASETTLAAFKTAFDARDLATQTTLAALLVKNTEIDAVLDTIYTRQNDRTQKTQLTNGTIDVTVTADVGVNRLEIQGKVQSVGAIPPPATTPVIISADTPLTVGLDDTTYTIPDGLTFHLQQITCGNEDPTKGAVTTLIFDDGTEHIIERVYTAGFTVQAGYSDIVKARDGTVLLGNGAGTSDIIVRREKYSGSDIAIDSEVIGYVS